MSTSWEQFFHIRSPKFPILPGEEEELVNPGMYGKALSIYLQDKLKSKGYDVPFFVCEDWGWWVEIAGMPFKFGVCIYCGPDAEKSLEYACIVGVTGPRVWSWKKFRLIDQSEPSDKLFNDLKSIFESDPEVEVLAIATECPVGPEEDEE